MFSSAAFAACEVNLEGTDKFNDGFVMGGKKVTEIAFDKSCKEVTFNLKHTGKLPAAAMGHNIVLAKKADVDAVSKDGVKAGAKGDYVKKDDKRVIAHTKLIGGGQSVTLKVDAAKINSGDVEAFCSYPAHHTFMKANVVFK